MSPVLRRIALVAGGILLLWVAVAGVDRRAAPAASATRAHSIPAAGAKPLSPRTRAAARATRSATAADHAADGQAWAARDPRVQRCQRDLDAATRARVAALARSDDERAQAVAARLQPFEPGEAGGLRQRTQQQLARLAVAAQRAPDDVQIAWLYAARCHAQDQCDQRAAIDRVLRLEPDNMAAWLLALEQSDPRDQQAQAALLQRAAAAPRLDWHYGALGMLVIERLTPLRVPSCDVPELLGAALGSRQPLAVDGAVAVTAGAVALTLPLAAGTRTPLCPARGSIAAARLPACRAVFARLADGDDLVSRLIGTTRMLAWAQTPAERAHWSERLRNLLWLQEQDANLMPPGYMRLVLEQGEVPTLIALMEEQGRWPAPPGWLPENPALRAQLAGLR
jgi:hypothetical protein